MLWLGILPALSIIYIRYYVNELPVWPENRRLQRATNREVRAPLFAIFRRGMIGNTMTACWFMASAFITYYSINSLFPSYMQTDLDLSPGLIATPIALANLVAFLASSSWGWMSRPVGPPLGDDHPGVVRHPARPALPVQRQLHRYRRRLRAAGRSRQRRHVRPDPGLSELLFLDRGSRDGDRLLLPSGRHLGRICDPCWLTLQPPGIWAWPSR